jgi:tetratricopeptide (TPR) repeat protein
VDYYYASNIALAYLLLGMSDRAQAWIDHALAFEPDAISPRVDLGRLYQSQEDYDRMLEMAEEILDLSPQEPLGFDLAGMAHWYSGREVEAEAWLRKNIEGGTLEGTGTSNRIALAQIAWEQGRLEEAQELVAPRLEQLVQRVDRGNALPRSYAELARITAFQGHKEAAYGYLEQALDAGATTYLEYRQDPCFARMRHEDRFQQLMARIENRVAAMRARVEAREASS